MNVIECVRKGKEHMARLLGREPMLLEVYERDNERLRQRVGHDRAWSTYLIRQRSRDHVADFVRQHYGCADMPLGRLTPMFIDDYCAWLSAIRGLHGGTVWLNCMLLKGVVSRACNRGLLRQNPFAAFHVSKNVRQRTFLTEEELTRLMAVSLSDEGLALARDLFVFSCFTALSYVDLKELTASQLVTINGEQWISSRRHKTGVPYEVKLLDAPRRIMVRYESLRTGEQLFPPCEYRTLCKRLRRVMQAADIAKPVTFHCSSHSKIYNPIKISLLGSLQLVTANG